MAVRGDVSLCTILATVPTGLEKGAASECKDILGRGNVVADRGKISFPLLSLEEIAKVDKLRSIENYAVLVKDLPNFCSDESTALDRLMQLPSDASIDWETPLSVWKYYHDMTTSSSDQASIKEAGTFAHSNTKAVEEDSSRVDAVTKSVSAVTDDETPAAGDTWSFRVTGVRGGRQHSFSSMDAAGRLGAALATHFGWKVQMKNSDIEVLLNVSGDAVKICLALSRESKSFRNITHFGPTTLKATIAYGLLRHASIQPGDIVLDPMCGGGSISIEGSLAWPSSYHLSGDIHDLATPRTMDNLRELKASRNGLKVDVLQWDVRNLPVRTASVDVVVTDLPFGKKSGRKVDNRVLYPAALEELGRVCRPSTARAVLLTHDNKSLSKALLCTSFWRRHVTKWINIGGLTAAVYVLYRTGNVHSH